jgi:hypothetical protein
VARSWARSILYSSLLVCNSHRGQQDQEGFKETRERELMSPRREVQKGCCLLYKGRGLYMCVCLAWGQTVEGVFQAQSNLWRYICPCG